MNKQEKKDALLAREFVKMTNDKKRFSKALKELKEILADEHSESEALRQKHTVNIDIKM